MTPTAARRSPQRTTTTGVGWDEAALAPVVLVQGPESLLVDRAVDRLTSQAREQDPSVERTVLDAAVYEPGQLVVLTSPSLFAEARLVILDALEAMTDALVEDVLSYVRDPQPDVWLVLVHRGGARGKKLLDGVRRAGASVVACEAVKREADKVAFASAEFRRARRRASQEAVRALVQAVGTDLRELGASCDQLMADISGTIDEETVNRYYGGRIEVTGFRVADAAATGRASEAAALLRHSLATGGDPVPLVAALAAKLRALAKVAGTRGQVAGLAPWQVDRARRDLAHWTPESLAAAITATAQADAEVKGASRDPVFAVERAVLSVARLAARG